MPLKVADEDVVEYSEFKGLRNNVGPAGYDLGDLEAAFNVDIDDALFVRRRKGHSAPVVTGSVHSLFAAGTVCLSVRNGDLVWINPDWTIQTVHLGIGANPVSYAAIGDRVYYANGVTAGAIQGGNRRSWGLIPPTATPAAITSGALLPGRYQYALTYLRSDGQESGASIAQEVTIDATGGFTLTLPVSADATVDRKVVYVSDRDGATLYRQAVLANADTSFVVGTVRIDTAHLETQFLLPPPAGNHVAYANGRMLVARGSTLFPSEPYAPELFDLRKAYPFLSRITMVHPLEDGTWLGTDDQVLWLPNAEPEKWEMKIRAEYGVIPGTAARGDGELIGDGSQKTPAVFFATKQGLCAGLSGGQLVNFTQDRFAYPAQARGAGIVRRHRGIAQYVATLEGAETAGNVAA